MAGDNSADQGARREGPGVSARREVEALDNRAAQAKGLSPRSADGEVPGLAAHITSLAAMKLSEVRTKQAEKEQEDNMQGHLTVYAATWNLNGKMPPHRLPELLGIGPSSVYSDLYAIGVQEAPSIRIEHQVLATLGPDYKKLTQVSLASIHLMLFVRKEVAPLISDIHTDRVATGVAAFFGNKGGVAATFTFQHTTFLFVTCHLAAHQESVPERNDQFGRISRTLFWKEREWARRVNHERSQPSSPRSPRNVRSPPPRDSASSDSISHQQIGSSSLGTLHSGQHLDSDQWSGADSQRSARSPLGQEPSSPSDRVHSSPVTAPRPEIQPDSPGRQSLTGGRNTGSLASQSGRHALVDPQKLDPPLPPPDPLLKPHVADDFDVIIWSGDLNYRVEGNRRVADAAIAQNMLEVLRANDQLLRERQAGHVFRGFQEGDLLFGPTYKFDEQSQTYDSSNKARIPSWTDRILYRSRNPAKALATLEAYGSVPSLKTSDHRPVYARFSVSTRLRRSAAIRSETGETTASAAGARLEESKISDAVEHRT